MATSHARRRLAQTLLPTLMLLSVAFVPGGGAATATTRVLTISTATAHPVAPFLNFDGNPPKLFDFDGDGIKEIIAQNDNQYVYVFNSKTGALLAQLKTTLPPTWGARSFNGPEAAVFDTNGGVRLIVQNSAAYVTSFRFDPTASNKTSFSFVKQWERRLTDCYNNPGSDSKPVLADLDRDGKFEIVAATEEQGIFALHDDGQVFWKNCMGGGNAEPGIGDLNGDGGPDVIYGSDGGLVSALNGLTGAFLWSYSVPAHFNVGVGSMPVGPAVGQLDGKGGPDIVVGVRDSHDAVNFSNDHALLLALDSGGHLLWGMQDPQGNPLTYTHAIIGDAGLDGRPEVYWGDWNTMGHKPPFDESKAWQVTGPAHYYRLNETGAIVWRQTISTFWSNKDLAVAEVTGDGVQDVLVNGPGPTGADGIWYLGSDTGAKEAFVSTAPWKVSRGAVVGDLWSTGTTQWVVEAGANDPSVSGGAILIYDTQAPYNAMWPHLPYPTLSPPLGPPPSTGSFNATFTIKSPNAWWQEVAVKPTTPRTVANVQIRVSNGFWQSMAKRTWGAWTSSFNTPAGTRVEFLATDAGGATSLSAPFRWMDGNLTQTSGSAPPPPPPAPANNTFVASFTVPSNVNEWWVEVRVSSTHPVVSVAARVNNGTAVALTAQSWGSWAKSFFVARSSDVRFLAVDTDGNSVLSPSFRWLANQTAPPPPPADSPFTANFTLASGVNSWWVETLVRANHTVSSVEAQVNGGTWVALSKTSWGSWAKSFFVAHGAAVRFRATDDRTNQVVSGTFVWP